MKPIYFICLFLCLTTPFAAHPAQAQTETVLYNFTYGSDGGDPLSGLTSDGTGNFYGTTQRAGLGYGTVFELSPNGGGGWNETVLYSFTGGADGAYPYADVIFDGGGNLYGTTYSGGASEYGVVFEVSGVGTSWTETVLHNFAGGKDGAYPASGLIMGPAGKLYGTTLYGGGLYGNGAVFELSPSGGGWKEKVILDIGGLAGLTMDAAGNIFSIGNDSVFELSPNGHGAWKPTVIHTFTGAPNDGGDAYGTPVLDQTGNLYGTTMTGGAKNDGTVYKLIRPTKKWQMGKWKEEILHSFGSGKDGFNPLAGIVFDADGNIYSTTRWGGKYVYGTVFELVAPVGKGWYKEKVLWSFNFDDGSQPHGSLILDSAGNLYGTTYQGGTGAQAGVVFEVSP
jgi:uncharacterized repeat protein (TIGR03803 family)